MNHLDHVILRVPLLYGEVENLDENAVTILLKIIQDKSKHVKMDEYDDQRDYKKILKSSFSTQVRYPTYVGDVAETCFQLCEQHFKQDISGIFHFTGLVKYTKFRMVALIASLFNLSIDHIERDPGIENAGSVQRPDNAQLDMQKLSQVGINIEQANFETTIRRCLETFI